MEIKGYCPMGCGRTLFRGKGGFITCSSLDCADPTAASKILADPETEHIVEISEGGFSIQHPLRERINGRLYDCEFHEELRRQPGPPAKPGRYRAIKNTKTLRWDLEKA